VKNDISELRRDETSRYLASIVESSDDAIISKNLDGIVKSWNAGAERMFGYSSSEMVGRTILRLFPPDLVEEELSILSRIIRGEKIRHYETVRIAKSGQRIAVSLTVSPVFDATGRVIGASKIARDISQRKALETAVKESLERQRLAVEAGELGLWSYDVGSQTSLWNPLCKTFFGIDPDAAIPAVQDILRLLHPDDSKRVAQAFQACVATGTTYDVDFRIVDSAGTIRWVHSKGRALRAPDGTVTQVHGTIADRTRQKAVEDALKTLAGHLETAYAAARELHEPLSNLARSLQLASTRSERSGSEPQVQLDRALQGARHIETAIAELQLSLKALDGAEGA